MKAIKMIVVKFYQSKYGKILVGAIVGGLFPVLISYKIAAVANELARWIFGGAIGGGIAGFIISYSDIKNIDAKGMPAQGLSKKVLYVLKSVIIAVLIVLFILIVGVFLTKMH